MTKDGIKFEWPDYAHQGMKWSGIAIGALLTLSFLGLLLAGKLG